jgi:hypothetical protein
MVDTFVIETVLWSRSRKEPHNFGGASSKLNVLHKLIIKNNTKCNSCFLFPFIFVTILIIPKSKEKIAPTLGLTLVCFQKDGLVYCRVGAGAAGAASKFLAGARAA